LAGAVVYADGSGEWRLAQGDAPATARAYGLLLATGTTGNEGLAANSEQLELTTGEWDAVAGTTGGLTPGVDYFLSDTTAGEVTETEPASSILVGRSITATRMAVQFGTSAGGGGATFDPNTIACDEDFAVVVDESFQVVISE
jgi:hypothetical protein